MHSWNPLPNSVQEKHVAIKDTGDHDEKHGKGMFATKNFDPSDIICSVSAPFLLALDTDRLNDTCYNCHWQPEEGMLTHVDAFGGERARVTVEKPLRLCSGCKVVRYCGHHCQKASWKSVHKRECDLFQALYPRIMPNHMRAVVRFIQMRDDQRINQAQWNEVMKCPSHSKEISARQDEEYVKLVQMARSTKEYAQTKLEYTTILRLYCKLKINSITLMTHSYDPIGLCMHPLLAKINHHCRPNAYIRFNSAPANWEDRGVQVAPLRHIEKDEEITISYVDENKPDLMRQAELLDRYFFKCSCSKCTECNEDIKGPGTCLSQSEQDLIAKVEGYIQAAETNTSKYMPVRNLSYALHLLSINQWPKGLYPYPQVLQKLVVAYIDDRQFNYAMAYAAVQTCDIDPLVHEQVFHPIRLTHLYVLVRLVTLISDAQHSDPFNQELDLRPFEIMGDLHILRTYLARILSRRAIKTYGSSAMWLHMSRNLYYGSVYNNSYLHDDDEDDNTDELVRKNVKLRKLIDAMYERNNDRSAWL